MQDDRTRLTPGPFARRPARRAAPALPGLLIALAASAACTALPAAGQTINGTLMDVKTEQPINLGLVLLYTESGDSVTSTITNERGYFSIASPEPGSFILLASAFGYNETPAGIFELGEDGVMTVQYRITPEPLPLDELVVSLNRPVLEHSLVRNGFVRRYQRGLGHFLTPYHVENSPAESTEQLFAGLTGVNVRTVNTVFNLSDRVQLRGTGGGWCDPTIYVDGIRVPYDYEGGDRLSFIVPLATVDAVEVYRRAAEIPIEYGIARAGGGGSFDVCGVVIFWTKRR